MGRVVASLEMLDIPITVAPASNDVITQPAEGESRPSIIRGLRHPDGLAGQDFASHSSPVLEERFCKRMIDTPLGPALVYQCVELDLVQEAVSPEAHLVIYAETIYVRSHVRLPGKQIFLFAREIIAEPDGQLDTGGGDPLPPLPKPGLAPQENTENGAPGAHGTTGTEGDTTGQKGGFSGGAVSVASGAIRGKLGICTNGGRGQNGQDGGDGRQGMRGRTGEAEQPGYPGGRGGDAGPGGNGGAGGNAGSLTIRVASPRPDGQPLVLWEMDGGAGGQPGASGGPGEGGPGGPGGEHWVQKCVLRHGELDCYDVRDGNRPNGPRGPSGNEVPLDRQPKPGVPGQGAEPNVGVVSVAEIGELASLPQCRMLLHEAELAYFAEDRERALTLLLWLEAISAGRPGSAARIVADPATPAPAAIRATAGDWQVLRSRVIALLRQLQMGRDYYGQLPNHVELVDFNVYRSDLKDLLAYAKEAADSYTEYWKVAAKQEGVRVTLRAGIGSIRQMRDLLAEKTTRLRSEREKIAKRLAEVLGEIEVQKLDLEEKANKLSAARDAVAGACGFGELLTAVGTIVVAGGSLYGGVLAAVEGLEQITKPHQGPRARIDLLKKVGGGLKDAGKAWGEIRGAVQGQPGSALMVVPANQWDAMTEEQLKELDKLIKESPAPLSEAAEEFKAELLQYRDLVTVANELRLADDALFDAIESIQNELVRLSADADRLATVLALAAFDPAVAEMVTFVAASWETVRQLVIRLLYEASRALEYAGVVDLPPVRIGPGYDGLRDAWVLIQSREISLRENASGTPQALPPIRIARQESEMPAAFASFKKAPDRPLSLLIRLDELPVGLGAIRAERLKVELKGVSPDANIAIKVVHSGRTALRHPNTGEVRVFTHEPRAFVLFTGPEHEKNEGVSLGGTKGEFAYLSPAGLWTIQLISPGAAEVIRDLTSIRFEFAGFGFAML